METPFLAPMDSSSTVYEPAEDSFLLLDALEQELDLFLSSRDDSDDSIIMTLEVGCGSGIISTALAKTLKQQERGNLVPCVFAIDVNPEACLLTQKNSIMNGLLDYSVQPVLMDGTNPNSSFRVPFDLIVCNPPYVPIQPGENAEDLASGLLEKSWSGGTDGNEFITPFLTNVAKMMSKKGVLFLLLSTWNDPEMLNETVAKQNGLTGKQVMKRTAGRERLSVWMFQKS